MDRNVGVTPLEPADIIDLRDGIGGDSIKALEEKNAQEGKGLGERVKLEVSERLGQYRDEILYEDDSPDVEIWDHEEVQRGTRGLGTLWKLSLYAVLTFAAYVFSGKPRFAPNWIPNITERDPIPKIYRPRRGHMPSSSSGQ